MKELLLEYDNKQNHQQQNIGVLNDSFASSDIRQDGSTGTNDSRDHHVRTCQLLTYSPSAFSPPSSSMNSSKKRSSSMNQLFFFWIVAVAATVVVAAAVLLLPIFTCHGGSNSNVHHLADQEWYQNEQHNQLQPNRNNYYNYESHHRQENWIEIRTTRWLQLGGGLGNRHSKDQQQQQQTKNSSNRYDSTHHYHQGQQYSSNNGYNNQNNHTTTSTKTTPSYARSSEMGSRISSTASSSSSSAWLRARAKQHHGQQRQKQISTPYYSHLTDVMLCLAMALGWTVWMLSSFLRSDLGKYQSNASILIHGHVMEVSVDLDGDVLGTGIPTYHAIIDYQVVMKPEREEPSEQNKKINEGTIIGPSSSLSMNHVAATPTTVHIRKQFTTHHLLEPGFANVQLLVVPMEPTNSIIKSDYDEAICIEQQQGQDIQGIKLGKIWKRISMSFAVLLIVMSYIGCIVVITRLDPWYTWIGWMMLCLGTALLLPMALCTLRFLQVIHTIVMDDPHSLRNGIILMSSSSRGDDECNHYDSHDDNENRQCVVSPSNDKEQDQIRMTKANQYQHQKQHKSNYVTQGFESFCQDWESVLDPMTSCSNRHDKKSAKNNDNHQHKKEVAVEKDTSSTFARNNYYCTSDNDKYADGYFIRVPVIQRSRSQMSSTGLATTTSTVTPITLNHPSAVSLKSISHDPTEDTSTNHNMLVGLVRQDDSNEVEKQSVSSISSNTCSSAGTMSIRPTGANNSN